MTAGAGFEPAWDDNAEDFPGAPLRWSICLALIAGLHIGLLLVALHWLPPSALPSSPPSSAVMIDMAALPAAPAATPNEMAPGPKQNFSQPPPTPEIQHPRMQAPPSPAPQIAIPLPPPKPPQQHRAVQHRPVLRHVPDKTPPAPASTAPPQMQAPPAPLPAAPSPGTASASPTAVPSWQAQLLARLEQFKKYPLAAQLYRQQGVVYLHFIMDRQGHVLSADIATSSGFDSLDQETLALIHRAEPLPQPPSEIPGNPIELTVPVQFFLK